MRHLILSNTDHELFNTMLGPEEYNYLVTHRDTLKRMWNEQGKAFWMKFLVVYRNYCYNTGTVYSMKKDGITTPPLCLHRISILSDQLFIVIHNEFVNCRFNSVKQFIDDLATLISNRRLLFGCRSTSISNNPFYSGETRDAFRKLLGQCKNLPPGLKELYYIGLGYPILGIFGGGVYHLLKRWISASEVACMGEKGYMNSCWNPPPEINKKIPFTPMPFYRHLLSTHNVEVDTLLLEGCFGLFSSTRVVDLGITKNKDYDCDCKSDSSDSCHNVYESFVEFICQKQEFLPNSKYDTEELRLDFEDYLRNKVDDFEDEEYRRSRILKLAEKKFQEELEQEKKLASKGASPKDMNLTLVVSETKTNGHKLVTASLTLEEVNPSTKEIDVKSKALKFELSTPTSLKKDAGSNTVKKTTPSGTNTVAKAITFGTNTVAKAITSGTNTVAKAITSGTNTVEKPISSESNKKSKKKNKKKTKDVQSSIPNPPNSNQKPGSKANIGTVKTVPAGSVVNSSEKNNVDMEGSKKDSQTKNAPNLDQAPKGNAKKNISSQTMTTIAKNIDCIQQTVKETNALSMEDFRLMVKTGSLLMNGNSTTDKNLQSCAHCVKMEETPKTFKKCARCKSENIMLVRFYCSRECQVENWLECHQEEHDKGLLPRK